MAEPTSPVAEVLLLGPPSSQRDSYELVFARHGMKAQVCEDSQYARQWLAAETIRAVVVTQAASGRDVDDFLEAVRLRHPMAPVFFAGPHEPHQIADLLGRHGVVILPPAAPSETLEQLLFPLFPMPAKTETSREGRVRRRTVVLHRSEYPLDFRRARAEFEAEFLSQALQRERGNVSRTARAIGMARRNLQLKIRAHRIDMARIRGDEEDMP